MSAMCPQCGSLPERPPAERIQDILDHRHHNAHHMHMRYEARRDYLQLCAEIDHLRAGFSNVANWRIYHFDTVY